MRIAIAHALLAWQFHKAARVRGRDEDLPTRGEHHAVPGGRDVPVREILHRLLDPVLALLLEVGDQSDIKHRVLPGREVVNPDVGPALIGDATRIHRGRFHVEVLRLRVLLHIAAVRLHRPHIQHAIAVAQEVEPTIPPHRIAVRAGVLRIELGRFCIALLEAPEILHPAAVIALRGATLLWQTDEEDRARRRVDHAITGLREGQHIAVVRHGIQRDELVVGQGGKLVRRVEHLVVRRPACDARRAALESLSHGSPAIHGHGIDLGETFVAADEGHRAAIGRDRGVSLPRRVRSEALGRSSLRAHAPEIAFGGEDHGVPVDRWIAVVTARAFGLNDETGQTGESEKDAHGGDGC